MPLYLKRGKFLLLCHQVSDNIFCTKGIIMNKKIVVVALFVVFSAFLFAHTPDCNHGHDHNHVQDNDPKHHEHEDDCSGHDHDAIINLTVEQIRKSGIKTARVRSGMIRTDVGFNGEIVVNRDLHIHHVPRTSGVVAKIGVDIADKVRKGDVLAIIDSAELAAAKSQFYEAFNSLGTAISDFQRANTIADNTLDLLSRLKESPELEILRNKEYGDMGKYRSLLLSSYSEYLIAKKDLQRQSELRGQRVVSETELLQAESDYEKAKSNYLSIKDDSRYEVRQNLIEAERVQRVMEFKMRSAQQRLRILGVTNQEIEAIKEHGIHIQQLCTDGACAESNYYSQHYHPIAEEEFSLIEIKAGLTGVVIARNLELGEEVESDRIIFTVADLNSLWVILNAAPRDLANINEGMKVYVRTVEGLQTQGVVTRISPVIDEKSRTAEVRVEIDNSCMSFKPGMFVTARVALSDEDLPVVVSREAVQSLQGHDMVFVKAHDGFMPVEVRTGREDRGSIEIISGLNVGDEYVSHGAFALKAIVITSDMDPCAGHNH